MTTMLHMLDDAGHVVQSIEVKEFAIESTPDLSGWMDTYAGATGVRPTSIEFDMNRTRRGRRYFRSIMRQGPVPAKRNKRRYCRR